MKGSYFAIVAKKDESFKNNGSIIFIYGSIQEISKHENTKTQYKPSGFVILCLCKCNRKTINKGYDWGQDEAKLLTTCKKISLLKPHITTVQQVNITLLVIGQILPL